MTRVDIPRCKKKEILFFFHNALQSYATGYSLITIIQAAVRLLLFLLAAKLLGPEEYSRWPLIQALMSYSMFIGLGVMPALGRELPICKGGSKEKRYNIVLGSSVKFLSYFWIVTLAFAIFVIVVSPERRFYSYGAFLAVLQSIIQLFLKIHRSELNFKRLFVAICPSVAWMLVSVFFLVMWPHLDMLFALFSFSLVIQIVFLYDGDHLLAARIARGHPIWHVVFHLQKTGMPLMMSGCLLSILFSVDRWLVNGFFEKNFLGQYAFAVFGAMGIQLLITSVSQVYYPAIAYGYGETKSLSSQRKEIQQFLLISLFFLCSLALSVWFVLPPIVGKFIPEYTGGLVALKWLILGGLGMPFSTLCSIIFSVKKILWPLVLAQGVGVLVAGVVIYLGCVGGTLEGVGKSVGIAYLAYSLCVLFLGFYYYKTDIYRKLSSLFYVASL